MTLGGARLGNAAKNGRSPGMRRCHVRAPARELVCVQEHTRAPARVQARAFVHACARARAYA